MSHVPRFRTSVERSPAGPGIDAWNCANRNTWLRMRLFIRLPLASSPNHLIGAQQDRLGDRQLESLRRLKINDGLELRGLLDRELGWLGAFQHPMHQLRGPLEHVGNVRAVAGETTSLGKLFPRRYHRDSALGRKLSQRGRKGIERR